jgi:hypothetical protein
LQRDELVAVKSGGSVLLYDGTDDGELRMVREPFDFGCLVVWFDRLAGSRRDGLWIPMLEYGAAKLW